MKSSDVIRRLHHHRAWVNAQILKSVENLTPEQLGQSHDIGQGSIWRTLTHLYAAEYVWLAALEGNSTACAPGDVAGKLPGNQEGADAAKSVEELSQRWRELETRWSDWLAAVQDDDLDAIVTRVSSSTSAGREFRHTTADVLLHVCTHAQYTVAQLVNMLRRIGQTSFPSTMLMALARIEADA